MSKPKSPEELFAGRHFDRDVIIVCVRWYLRYKLGLRDLVENTKNDPGAHATGSSNPALRVSPYDTVDKTLTERHCRRSGGSCYPDSNHFERPILLAAAKNDHVAIATMMIGAIIAYRRPCVPATWHDAATASAIGALQAAA
ncbi:hypothetical protein QF001_003289 [Paraburkholderia youngii]